MKRPGQGTVVGKAPPSLFLLLLIGLVITGASAERPNVLLIMCDDLNDYVETLGGHPQVRTPNMKRLIDTGVTFTQAHCNIPICAPSRASMMTGIYPHHSGQFGFENWRQNQTLAHSRTMMDHFRAHGYYTLGTGKVMHVNDRQEWMDYGHPPDYSPFANDWASNIAHPDVPSPYRDDFGSVDGSFGPLLDLTGKTAPGSGRAMRWVTGNHASPRTIAYRANDQRDPTADELTATWAVARLDELAQQKDGKPFFMGVGFIRPHTPMIVPKKYFDRFPLDAIALPPIKDGDNADTCKAAVPTQADSIGRHGNRGFMMYQSLVASYGGDRELALKKFIQAYLASIASVDDLIGDILDVIDNSALKHNTIIILTSDHGWQMGQKDYLYKNSLWQESTRIPLVIRAPGLAKAGGRCARPVSLIDIYPTLIDLCELPNDTTKSDRGCALDGFSLVPLLRDPDQGTWNGPDAVLTTIYQWNTTYDAGRQSYALRSADWRYIRYETGAEELYHTAVDPHEWTNLAADPAYAVQRAAWREKLLTRIPPPSAAVIGNQP